MQKPCEVCGCDFTAQRSTARYCGEACKKRAQRAAKKSQPVAVVVPIPPRSPQSVGVVVRSLYETCRDELGVQAGTAMGTAALLIARRLDDGVDTSGAAVASLTKELHRLMELSRPVEAVEDADDPIAYLQRRADERRNRVG